MRGKYKHDRFNKTPTTHTPGRKASGVLTQTERQASRSGVKPGSARVFSSFRNSNGTFSPMELGLLTQCIGTRKRQVIPVARFPRLYLGCFVFNVKGPFGLDQP